MSKKKLFLAVLSVLCAVLTVLLIAAAVGIYREGAAIRAEQPLSWIYSREKAASGLAPLLPLFVVILVLTAAGLVLGIRDDGKRPAKSQTMTDVKAKNREPGAKDRVLRLSLLALAVLLIVAGVLNGSALDVLGKAIKICTECVGLG